MSNLIFEIKNVENNFQIGIFENFENKEDLLKLYESLIVSTEKEFDKILNGNLEISFNESYYITSNAIDNDLISSALNKSDVAFVEQVTKLTENLEPIEYLSFGIKKVKKEIVSKPAEPTQLEILLGFKSAPLALVSKAKPNKPGRGQKSCKFCNEVIGVRCLICKFCNSNLT